MSTLEQLWPPPSPEAADVIRSVCQQHVNAMDGLVDMVTGTARTAQNDPALFSDAALAHEDRQVNHSDVVHWLTSNIQRPGFRVEPYIGARTTAYIHDLALRGLDPDFAEGWRAALAVAWRRWLGVCLAQCTDPDLLVEVLHVAAQSLVQYAIDWAAAFREASVVADAKSNANAVAVAMIQMIANGASIPQDFAERRLNYRLARWHQAMVLWTDDPRHLDSLEEVVDAVRSTPPGRASLVARASTRSRWLWLSGTDSPDLRDVETLLVEADQVQSALGRPGYALEGFRSSHQDALAAQAMVMRLGSMRRFTAYADVELIDTLTKDRASAQRFVTKTLGPLAEAEETLRQALLTYVQSGFNTTRTAAALYAHRNTVERRVSRANDLSMVKLEDNPTHVAAALLVLEVAPDLAVTDPS